MDEGSGVKDDLFPYVRKMKQGDKRRRPKVVTPESKHPTVWDQQVARRYTGNQEAIQSSTMGLGLTGSQTTV